MVTAPKDRLLQRLKLERDTLHTRVRELEACGRIDRAATLANEVLRIDRLRYRLSVVSAAVGSMVP
jgi:division protein CdvB (Snf7/Vps24/ESCRT-III family)